MRPLRLLAVIEAGTITGPAKNLLEFARLGRDAGVETTIATFVRGTADNLFIQTARLAGIPLEVIQERGPIDPAAMRALAEIADRLRPDVIQSHAVKSHFLVRNAGLPRRARWVAFHHGYTWPTVKARMYNQLDRWSLRTALKVLTVSVPFREELASRGVDRGRIEIIHNAIPPGWGLRNQQQASALRESLGIPCDRKVILIVGRLSREKDHLTLLDAIDRIRPLKPHLVVVGEGPERSRIQDRIRSLSLGEHVTLTGQQTSAERYYGIADVAVLSSLSEGSPNALLEAMAAQVPVIATAVGGVPEIVTNEESALLIRPSDSTEMAHAIERLLSDANLATRLVERSRNLVVERHAPEARVRRLVETYRHLMNLATGTTA